MEKARIQELYIENKTAGFSMEEPKAVELQLQLLPPDILRDILSRLSLKEVSRMSILSREWRRLRIYHPELIFTKDTFFGSDKIGPYNLASMTTELITKLNHVLQPLWSTSTTTTLDKFVVKFRLDKKHKDHVDKWIRFSIAFRAKHIALDFTFREAFFGSKYDGYKYVVPLCDLSGPNGSRVRSLYLGNIYLELPPKFCGITNLKRLALNSMSISGDDLQSLLLSCALLESLSLESFSSLSSVRIPQELCRLQNLHVLVSDMEMIELHAPNLKKIEFDDYLNQLVLNECVELSEATFVSNMRVVKFDDYGFNFTITGFPTALVHVHKLFLLLNVDQVLRFTNNQSRFINLRHLNINLTINDNPHTSWAMGLVNLLELAPLLEELELHLSRDRFYPSAIWTATAVHGPLHRHLKSVYMSGFCDILGLAELALYILRNTTTLKRMVVDPVAYADPLTNDIYSVRMAGSIKGDRSRVNQNRIFAEKKLDREEFRQIVTILRIAMPRLEILFVYVDDYLDYCGKRLSFREAFEGISQK